MAPNVATAIYFLSFLCRSKGILPSVCDETHSFVSLISIFHPIQDLPLAAKVNPVNPGLSGSRKLFPLLLLPVKTLPELFWDPFRHFKAP